MARPAIKANRGLGYLHNTSMAYLKQCHKKEKDIRGSARLSAYTQSVYPQKIAPNVNRHRSTVHK